MRLVIDTNIIISSLISNSVRRSILLNSGYEFISPEYTYKEIINHIDLIEKKSKIRVSTRCSEFCEAIRGS